MSYKKFSIDGIEIETQELNRGWKTEKGRIKKYIGVGFFLLIGILVSLGAASHQASASVGVYEQHLAK